MDSISELRPLTPRPAALAEPGYQTAKARTAAADPKSVGEALRSLRPEDRWSENRIEREQSQNGKGVPEAEFSFGDFLDLINPLQHIPIVSTIYRAITGDEIGGPARIMGGLLFGGPIGFIASIINTVVAEVTGRDLGETIIAAFIDPDEAPAVLVAEARDIESTPPQGDASGGGPPAATGTLNPISGHGDPLDLGRGGLERGVAAPIAVTPGALRQIAAVEPAERPATPGAGPPAQNARPLAAATPWPQTATIPGTGPGTGLSQKSLVPVAQGPDAFPIPVAPGAPGAPVVAVERISAGAPKPGSQPLVASIATTDRGFAERMLEALDKYQVLTSERFRDNKSGTGHLDLNL